MPRPVTPAEARRIVELIRYFEKHNVEIPRKDMPQIKRIYFDKFLRWLKSEGYSYKIEVVNTKTLNATQSNFYEENVRSVVENGLKDKRPVLVSSDNYILDGHHRFLGLSVLGNGRVKVMRLSMPLKSALTAMFRFPDVKKYEGAAS